MNRTGLPTRIRTALFAPVDIAFLVFFRIVFGAIMLWEVYRYLDHEWIRRFFREEWMVYAMSMGGLLLDLLVVPFLLARRISVFSKTPGSGTIR